MLSQSQSKRLTSRPPKEAYPLLEGFRVVRLQFSKTGSMQYISHLDLQRNLARVLTRAGIPMWYTKGFNPHAKIVFGLPLSVGAQSVCEMVDLRVERDMPCEEIRDRLNEQMTDEMQVIRAYYPEQGSDFSAIAWCEYDVRVRCAGLVDALPAEIERYLSTSPLMIEKKSKSGLRELDMIPLIRSIHAEYDDTQGERVLCLRCVLAAGGADYLNPEYLIRALRDRFSLMTGDPRCEEYDVLRCRVLREDGSSFA